ncbi:MAG: tetraacyldisaccharide 4'-kinase [Ignavibacteria bacterium RBG_16_34_14]|nr:MAG: tetraacyldisaccharide 4'-kinase [Ignavibacteria bacterium RBG_16_34_14]
MDNLRVFLFPFVILYVSIIKVRNWFFDNNFFRIKKVEAKVISVGNISIGGSGKTPLVIYLANLLKSENKKVGVLSRGYRRKTSGYRLVCDGEKILLSVDEAGDEMFHTVLECQIPAAVSENRLEGAQKLISETGIDTILLDDAFQHRWIYRDINILIFEQRFLNENDFPNHALLPAGNMREKFDSVERADLVVINRKFTGKMKIPDGLEKYFNDKPLFTSFYKAIGFVDMTRKTEYGLQEFEGQKSLVVAGIARPFSFLNILGQTKVDTQNKMIFVDHKDYSLKEVQRIRKEFYATNSYSVVTTQKDAVKLMKYAKQLDDIDVFYLKIELKFDEEDKFKNFILNHLN